MEATKSNERAIRGSLWPDGKRFAIAFGVDDVHPESRADGEGIDYGGEMDSGNFGQLSKLVELVPELRITLFVTPAWTMRPDYFTGRIGSVRHILGRKRAYEEDRFSLDSPRHSAWCSWLTKKIGEGNFEVAVHGLTHFNGSARKAGLEFNGLSADKATRRITRAEEIFRKAGIPFVKGFRQPGWYWNEELLVALDRLRYEFFAGSGDMQEPITGAAKSRRTGYPGVSLIFPDRIPGHSFVTLATNAREGEYERVLQVAKSGGLLFFHTHVGPSAYGVKSLKENSASNFAEMIGRLKGLFTDQIWFASLSEVTARYNLQGT